MSPKRHQKKTTKHHQRSAAAKARAALDPKPPLPSSDALPPRPDKEPVVEQARPPPERFISLQEMLTLVPVTHPTLWSWVRRGIFPRPRKIGPKRIGWPQSVYDAWKAERPVARYKGEEEVHEEA